MSVYVFSLPRSVREKRKSSGATATAAGSGESGGDAGGGGGGSGSGGGEAGAGPALWPPLRHAAAPPRGAPDPRRICSSGVLTGALLAVLHRGVHKRAPEHASSPHAHVPAPADHVLALAVYLLRQAARLERAAAAVCVAVRAGTGLGTGVGPRVSGRPLLRALPSELSLPERASTVVGRVPRATPSTPAHLHDHHAYPAHYHSDS